MSVEQGERPGLGLAAGAGGVAACAACCAPPVIGLLGIGTGAVTVLSTAVLAGVLVALVVALGLAGYVVLRRRPATR